MEIGDVRIKNLKDTRRKKKKEDSEEEEEKKRELQTGTGETRRVQATTHRDRRTNK